MSEIPNENPKPENDNERLDVDLLQRLPPSSPFRRRAIPATDSLEHEPIEEFWATFAMITHTGERFTLSVCFRNQQHYNAEMHKFETAKNIHIVLKDINGESVVIKRDMLLHVLPSGDDNLTTEKKEW